MKVKDLIKKLKTFNPNKNVCIYHQKLDDNYWDMDIQDDECNDTDVRITPYIEGENEQRTRGQITRGLH